jgi:uncharacterized protein YqjF (DUF2071 family)
VTLPGGFLVDAPELPRPVLFDQHWCDLAFIHWPVRPESVAHLFPAGVRPDVFSDGFTYVALVPFAMRDAGLGRRPVPYFGTFLETNIRLYSIDDAGRHGVLFRSLETSRLAIVPAARSGLGIPYTWARMRSSRDGDVISYDSVRRWPERGLRSHVVLRIGASVEPTPLETWLTARWGAHSRWGGRTIWTPNAHGAWPLHAAEVLELDDDLLGASGVSPAGPRLRALWSPGVHSRFSRPRTVRPG